MNASMPDSALAPVHALLEEAGAHFPTASAMDFMGRRWTYGELADMVDRVACGLQHLGVRKGVRVGLCLPNTPYFVVCYYAILKAGGVVVNFNPLYVEREILHQIEDSGTTIMITLDLRQIYPRVAAMLGRSCLEKVVVCSMGGILPTVKSWAFKVLKRSELADIPDDLRHIPFDRLLASPPRPQPQTIRPDTDLAVLQYTGGTTGVPKGAMLTHANLSANVAQMVIHLGGLNPGRDRMLCVLPLFHVFAMTVAMNLAVKVAAELILVPRFDIRQVMKLIARKRPTLFPGVPTIYTAINAAAAAGKADLSSLQLCVSGGAPLPLEVRTRFEALTGCRLVEGYGLSEASPVVTCNPVKGEIKDGSIGVALAGTVVEVRSTEDPSRIVPKGEKGEICVRGPQVMAGYWNRPAETSAVMIDGALRTGDVGYEDEDGHLFLVDRIKDLILCGGYNVYPRVVEEALYRHPAVAEAIVIGIPDAYRGQAPKAFVRLRDGAEATPAELKTFLGDQLSRIEMPAAIEIRDELPKTMVGKLSKKELVAEEQAKMAAQTLADVS